jgi:hypothetical protein
VIGKQESSVVKSLSKNKEDFMKIRLIAWIAKIAAVALLAIPQSTASQATSFAGTWTAEMNGLPGMRLTIGNAAESINGTVIFYMQKRNDVNAPWHVAGEYRSPILRPHVEDKTLTFEVQHHTCDGCPELGPNVHFRMELTGPEEARLWRLEDGRDSPGYKLVHNEATQQ